MARTRRSSARETELSRALLASRERAGLSQERVAEACGLRQNAISRFESARAVPTLQQVDGLLDALRIHAVAERQTIIELARKALSRVPENVPSRVVLERGVASFQQRILDLEEDAELIRSFHPSTIIGVLQTESYITEVFRGHVDEEELAKAVAKRLERQRLLLDGSGRRWVLLQTEGALRWNFAGGAAMAEQMDAISEVVESSGTVRVGIIPSMIKVDVQPLTGFHVYDFAEEGYRRDVRMAMVGTHTGTALLKEVDAGVYVSLFEQLQRAAVFGDGALELLGRIADEYREMQ